MSFEKIITNDKEILIIDDILEYVDVNYLYILCCQSKYTICNSSQSEIQKLEDRRLKCDLQNNHPILDLFFREESKSKKMFCDYIDNKKFSYSRSYINLGVTSDVNQKHVDNKYNSRTVLYYANREWDPSWGGQTIFLDDYSKDIVKTVTPVPGRFVIFDGRIPHNVLQINPRSAPSYRFTVALKFEPLKNEDTQQWTNKSPELTDTMDNSLLYDIKLM